MKKRLDTTAIVHTARMNENTINAYRISIAMDHTVNPQLLQQAVDNTTALSNDLLPYGGRWLLGLF